MNKIFLLCYLSCLVFNNVIHAQYFKAVKTITSSNGICGGVSFADINGDGKKDIIATGSTINLVWSKNTANNVFLTMTQIHDGSIFGDALDVADVDKDGDMDIISAVSYPNKIIFSKNKGNGTFENIEVNTSIEPVEDLELADLDNDGKLDIIFSTYNASNDFDQVQWLKNLGSDQFSGVQTISLNVKDPKKLFCTDLTGDGLLDVIVVSYFDKNFSWHKNLGGGIFSDKIVINNTAAYNNCVTAADYDGDGDQDILVGNGDGSIKKYLLWYENDGTGFFTPTTNLTNDGGYWDVKCADLDGDGDMDVVTGDVVKKNVKIFLNKNSGKIFEEQIIASGLGYVRDIDIADADGDGDPDITIVTSLQDLVLFFENIIPQSTSVINQTKDISLVEVWPNPALDKFSVHFTSSNLPAIMQIYDINGQLKTSLETSDHFTNVETTNWNAGKYFIVIKDKSKKTIGNKVLIIP
ncbi:MAG: T9SS type A sorting domain-containing protein [Saprospiraceae bacterium]|nr:T9SS type A sorting domain-containing protein [Saprospiraceae bacterium]